MRVRQVLERRSRFRYGRNADGRWEHRRNARLWGHCEQLHHWGGESASGASAGGASATDDCPAIDDLRTPEVIINISGSTNGLSAEGDALYFANGLDQVMRWREGMAAPEVVSDGPAERPIAVVGDTLYYGSEGTLYRAPLATIPAQGTPASEETIPNLFSCPWTHDDEAFYYAEYNVGTVRKVPFNGSPGSDLAQATQPQGLAVLDGWLYYAASAGSGVGFRRVATAGGEDDWATAARAYLYTGFATDGNLFWITEQPRLLLSSVGGTEQDPPRVSQVPEPTRGVWMENPKMVGDTLYLAHAQGGCARVTADGTCRIISDSIGTGYSILGDYIYYKAFSGGDLFRLLR